MEGREVVGTIAQQRHTFLSEVSEGEFTKRALRQRFTGIRIKDLRIEIVFVQVGSTLVFTFVAHTRTGDLTQAINIVGFNAQRLLQFDTHFLRPGLCAEDTDLQFELLTGIFALLHGLTEEHGV